MADARQHLGALLDRAAQPDAHGVEGRGGVAHLARAAGEGEVGHVSALAEGVGRDAEMLDRHQLAAHEPDGEAKQNQGKAKLGDHIGEARAESQPHVGYQHVHDVVAGELDLDQELVAAHGVVDVVGFLEVGIERALDLARHDIEIGRCLELPHDAFAEGDEQQHVGAGVAQDPGPVLIVGKIGAHGDQQAQVAYQQQRQPVGHVVAALTVEPPGRHRLQEQHRYHQDDQRARKQGLRRMPVGPARDRLELVGKPSHALGLTRPPAGSPGRAPCAGSAESRDRARSCGAGA